jgi:predicted phage terminase large subunit-like protein
VSYIDYAQGKQKKRNDFSAIVTLSYYGGANVYVDCSIERRNVEETNSMLISIIKVLKHTLCGAETVNFQELAKDDLEKKLREEKLAVECIGIDNKVQKDIRIGRLAPWCKLKVFKFRRNCEHCLLLLQQLLNFGQPSEHDDGPDGMEGAMRLLTSVTGISGGDSTNSDNETTSQEDEDTVYYVN